MNWTLSDFIIMGTLLASFISIFVFTQKKLKQKHKLFGGIGVALAFLYLWAELAVGIFTNWGS